MPDLQDLARLAGYDVDADGSICMPHYHADGPADERAHLARFAALVADECANIAAEDCLSIGCSAEDADGVVRRTRDAIAAAQRAAFPMPKE